MLFVFNVPCDLLSEEVGADGRQPVDAGAVVLSLTRLLQKISHKRPEENATHSRFHKILQIKLTENQENKARQEYDLDRFLTFYTWNFYINTS